MDATAKKPLIPRLSPRWVTVGEYLLILAVVFYAAVWCLYTSANCNTALRVGVPLLGALLVLRGRPIPLRLCRRVGFVAAYLGVYLVATRYNGVRFVLYYILPLLLLLLYTGSAEDGGVGLLHKLSDIMTVITALSLFFYLFGTVLRWIPRTDIAAFYWGGGWRTCPTYFHLYYEAQQITFFGWDLPRNCGVFPEAPGFAVFLVAATAAEVLLRRPRVWRCVLFAAATVTTVSVKAFLLMAAVFTLRYVLWPPVWISRRLRRWLFPMLGVGMTLAASALLWDKLTSVSGFMRLDDVAACLKAFVTAPIFGTGYWNDASIVPFFSYPDRYNNGLSMGAAVILAQGGVYLSALYWWPAVDCVRRNRGARRRWAAFALIYAALLFSGNIVYHFLTLLLIAVLGSVGREGAP